MDSEDEVLETRFRGFGREAAGTSPLYRSLCGSLADDVAEGGLFVTVMRAAPLRRRMPNLVFAAVQRVLFDEPGDPLAEYYPSLGGGRVPDAELFGAFTAFVVHHRERIEALISTGETQTNEVLRSGQVFPALGWAHACTRRPLGLIEVGTSAGLLLHADRYSYVYEFDDGSVRHAGLGDADGVPDLHCAVSTGEASDAAAARAALEPFIAKDLRVASRVGLDVNPLDPANPEDRAWLRALVWPEHTERRTRLEAALDHARRRPVRLRKGTGLRLLPDAVDSVPQTAIPCVFVSNSLPHWEPEDRGRFVALVRELGARRDLVLVLKELYAGGLGLFTGRKHDPSAGSAPGESPAVPRETLAAAVFLGGSERLFHLGTAGMHGAGLEWSPRPAG
jgi:hypothetical protein